MDEPRGGPEEADLASAQEYELKGHRLCGNCWVEGWPANVRPRSLDGLNLRLDLRLEPLEATKTELDPRAEQASATVTEPGIGPARGFTQRIASRALSVPRSVQALSVAAGLGVVLVSLAIWNSAIWSSAIWSSAIWNSASGNSASGNSASGNAGAPPQGNTNVPAPAAASSRLTAASSEAAAPSSVDAGSSGAKASAQHAPSTPADASSASGGVAALAAAPVMQHCPEPSVERRTAGTPGASTRTHARGRASLDGTSQRPILASTRREASGAASSAEADLMYLFSDIR